MNPQIYVISIRGRGAVNPFAVLKAAQGSTT